MDFCAHFCTLKLLCSVYRTEEKHLHLQTCECIWPVAKCNHQDCVSHRGMLFNRQVSSLFGGQELVAESVIQEGTHPAPVRIRSRRLILDTGTKKNISSFKATKFHDLYITNKTKNIWEGT